MLTPLWKSLSLLASYDFELKKIDKEISSYEEKNIALKDSFTELKNKHNETLISIQSLKNKIESLEKRLHELETQELSKKKHLEKCSSSDKEYKPLKKEIQSLEMQSQDYEDQLITAWHDQERLEKKYASEKSEFFQKKEESLDFQEKNNQEKEKELLKKNELLKEREKVLVTIPEKWRNVYGTMKNKVENPIVALVDNACSACYYPILSHEKAALKKNHIMHCHSCYRLLYYQEE